MSLEATQHDNWSSPAIETLPSFSGVNFCEVTPSLHVRICNGHLTLTERSSGISWYDFMHRSFIEQISTGKDIVEQYYGETQHHTYWNVCSEGGRQGYAIAQRNSGAVGGILAAAPAINLSSVAIGVYWPQVVMNGAKTFPSQYEFDWFKEKLMEECDALDGYEDGVLIDPEVCKHGPRQLIGSQIKCDGEAAAKVTSQMVGVVRQITEGTKSPLGAECWHGLALGTNYLSTANITISPDGVTSINPHGLPLVHDALLLPGKDFSAVSQESYLAMWTQAFHEWQ